MQTLHSALLIVRTDTTCRLVDTAYHGGNFASYTAGAANVNQIKREVFSMNSDIGF